MANENEIRIEIATPTHRAGILEVAKNAFVKNEPVRVATGVTWESARSGWEKLVDECLQNPHTHVAVNGDNEVVGIRLSRILNLANLNNTESINDFMTMGHIRTIEDHLTKDWAKIFINDKGERCEKLLQFLAVAVLPEYGGRGIARNMSFENMALGKELGCDWCSVVGSNWMSQRVFEKLGFKTVATFLFADYRDENGEKLFEVTDVTQTGSKWQVKKL